MRHPTVPAALLFPAFLVLAFLLPSPVGFADGTDPKAEAERQKAVEDLVARLKAKESDVRITAALDAKAQQDPKVTAALVHALSDADVEVRKAVLAALAARSDDAAKKSAATAIAGRLPRLSAPPSTEEELLAALAALHDLAQPVSMKALVDGVNVSDVETKPLRARLRAVANVPTAEAVDALIDLLARGHRGQEWRRIVRDALVYATGEKIGNDPDSWRAWWKDRKTTFDYAGASARRADERAKEAAREKKKEEKDKPAPPPGGTPPPPK